MAEERRSAPRARLSGVRVTYESAAGDHVETDVPNLGRGGLFVRTATPLAVGKRIVLEIQVTGEATPWSALGRVVWARDHDHGLRQPPGMGVKLIDVEDDVLAAIDRLVAGHEETDERLVQTPAAPVHELLSGVTTSTTHAVSAAPAVAVVPNREKTILGIGSTPTPAEPFAQRDHASLRAPRPPHEASTSREPSVVIDLIAKEDFPEAMPFEGASASDEPTVVRRRGAGRWFLVFAVLALGAVAAYAYLDGDLERVWRMSEPAAAPPPPSPPSRTTTTTTSIAAAPTMIAASAATALPAAAPTSAGTAPPPANAVPVMGSISGTSEPRRIPSGSSAVHVSAPPSLAPATRKPAKEDNPY